ncbi:hypothetical protein Pla163_37010 [Planctomycetes bacterium Pla163]|uniref:FlgN protein n=1 Tax=Rohdeia mirabilis TaxID=2528008 RepID=A0A518D503_9BACT|nr:hypothetical protein Pla163_37010 [Planctomycetes bacterium Pla163]
MNPRSLLPRLEAWAQEELGVQQRLEAALIAHEQQLGSGSPEDVEASLRGLQGLDARGAARRRELDRTLRELAAAWGLAAGTLTLGSVAERFGPDGEGLGRLRVQLRAACEAVQARSRRVALVARQQREIVRLALDTVLGPQGLDGERGVLVDSRG